MSLPAIHSDISRNTKLFWRIPDIKRIRPIIWTAGTMSIVLLLSTFNLAYASNPPDDDIKIAIGGYTLSRYDSTMALTEQITGAGVSISPEDTLGLAIEQTVLRLEGHYRFNKHGTMTFSWYSIDTSGTKVVEEEFDWVDEDGNDITIPVGAYVDSSHKYDIYKIGYLWSFYNSNKVELAAGAGLHITRLKIDLTASTTSSGASAENVETTLPLPVFSFGLKYKISPKINWYIKSAFFAISLDDWEGSFTDSNLGLEYKVRNNFGVGIGLGSNALRLTEETTDYTFTYDNRISGVSFYVIGEFAK